MNDISKRPLQGTPWLQLQTEGEEAMNPGVRPSPADEPDRLSDAENQTEQALTRGPSPTQQGTDRQQAGAHGAFSLESLMPPRRLHYMSSRLLTFRTDAPFGGDASHSLPRCCA